MCTEGSTKFFKKDNKKIKTFIDFKSFHISGILLKIKVMEFLFNVFSFLGTPLATFYHVYHKILCHIFLYYFILKTVWNYDDNKIKKSFHI